MVVEEEERGEGRGEAWVWERARRRDIRRMVFGEGAAVAEVVLRMVIGREDGVKVFSRGEGEAAGKRKASNMGSRLRLTARGGVGRGLESELFVGRWRAESLLSGPGDLGRDLMSSIARFVLRK